MIPEIILIFFVTYANNDQIIDLKKNLPTLNISQLKRIFLSLIIERNVKTQTTLFT